LKFVFTGVVVAAGSLSFAATPMLTLDVSMPNLTKLSAVTSKLRSHLR
jgi:hypothetical protein